MTVELAHDAGITTVQLTHPGLSKPMRDHHAGGWANFLPRMKEAAEA